MNIAGFSISQDKRGYYRGVKREEGNWEKSICRYIGRYLKHAEQKLLKPSPVPPPAPPAHRPGP